MIVDVEPVPGRPGRWNADCGAHHVHSVRTPLLSMARKLLEAGFDPEIELRMTHRGAKTVAMRVKIGDAAKLTVVENDRSGPRFSKYQPMPDRDELDPRPHDPDIDRVAFQRAMIGSDEDRARPLGPDEVPY
jgi:hypothetical protein